MDSVTKEGTEIYTEGKVIIKNNGREIKISQGGSIAALKKAIEIARKNYGDCLQVNGSALFKKTILDITVKNNIPICFADSHLEAERQKMILTEEKSNEQ